MARRVSSRFRPVMIPSILWVSATLSWLVHVTTLVGHGVFLPATWKRLSRMQETRFDSAIPSFTMDRQKFLVTQHGMRTTHT